MASFSIPLTGLESASTALNTIANDLSNMNTTAFKAQTTNFADLFYQQIGSTGSGDPIELGAGVQVASNETAFTQGSINSTGNSTDVALDGSGFFVVNNGGGGDEYTRAGDFSLTSTGSLVTSNGLSVMGYPAVNGVVNTDAPLTAIQIPVGQVQQPQATTTLNMTANLDATSTTGDPFPAQITVYDSLGVSHVATVTYTQTAANTWSYSVSVPDTLSPDTTTTAGTSTYNFGTAGTATANVDPSSNLTITGTDAAGDTVTTSAVVFTYGNVPGSTTETPEDYATDVQTALDAAKITSVSATPNGTTGVNLTANGTGTFSTSGSVIQDLVPSTGASGTLTFDASGNLATPGGNVSGITFAGLSDGANSLNMTWDLYGTTGSGTVTQTDATSTTSNATQNGYPSGQYESFSVASSGVVTATYSNGQTTTVGQIALASVANEQGLESIGSSDYVTTTASGEASVGVAGAGGRGTITGSALEASNVNISAEFSALIVAQRAFEASSKAVTTFDTVTQDAIAMVH